VTTERENDPRATRPLSMSSDAEVSRTGEAARNENHAEGRPTAPYIPPMREGGAGPKQSRSAGRADDVAAETTNSAVIRSSSVFRHLLSRLSDLPRHPIPTIAAAAAAALLLIPSAAGYAVWTYVSASHRILDGSLLLPNGSIDRVTALVWSSPPEEHLLVGTQSGRLLTFDTAGAIASTSEAGGAVIAIGARNVAGTTLRREKPFAVTLDRQPPTGRLPPGALGQNLQYGPETCRSGYVWREGRQGDAVCVEPSSRTRALQDNAQVADPAVPTSCGGGKVFREAFPGDTACVEKQTRDETVIENHLDQSRKVLPDSARAGTRELKALGVTGERGLIAVAENLALAGSILPPSNQATQQIVSNAALSESVGLTQWLLSEKEPIEVGQVFGIEDVRALRMLPGTSTAIAGDGSGGIFAIDASQQISGVNPSQYIVRLGNHDAAITTITSAGRQAPGKPSFATGAADGSVKAWQLAEPSRSALSAAEVRFIDVAPNGRKWTQTAAIRDPSWKKLEALSEDGSLLAVTLNDDSLAIVAIGDPTAASGGGKFETVSRSMRLSAPVAFSPGGQRIAAFNARTGSIDLVAIPLVQPTRNLVSSRLPPRAIVFSPDGKIVTILSTDGTITIVDVVTGNRLATPILHAEAIAQSIAFDPSGSLMAVVMEDGTVSINRVADGSSVPVLPFVVGSARIQSARFSSSGKELVLFDPNAASFFYYSVRGRRLIPSAAFNGVLPRSLSSDGSRYLSLPSPTSIAITDAKTGAELGRIPLTTPLRDMVYNGDTSRIVVLDQFGMTRRFSEEGDDSKHGLLPPLAEDGLRLSADGSTLLLREPGGKLHLADLAREVNGRAALEPLRTQADAVFAELSPDGKSVIIGEPDGAIELLDIANGNNGNIMSITGHGDVIQMMAISPDGVYLASASLDGRLRITDLALMRELASLPLASLSAARLPSTMKARYLEPETDQRTAERSLVMEIQQSLNDLGYGPLPVDGLPGPLTLTALRRWQVARSIEPTGEISPDTLRALKVARASDTKSKS